MEFKVGDKAIYPGHGLVKIDSIDLKEISGAKQKFYSVMLLDSKLKIFIPENRMKRAGLRSIVTRVSAKKALNILTDPKAGTEHPDDSHKTWSKRYQRYLRVIKSGNIIDTAKVIRELLNGKNKKELSFNEKQLMKTLCKMFFDEVSMVVQDEEIKQTLNFSGLVSHVSH